MYEQDYIMHIIHEIVRTLLKLIFHIDSDSPSVDLLKDTEEKLILNSLYKMIEEGKINAAENKLYEMTENEDKKYLEVALFFYAYLNDKPDEFLIKNNFSREEIKLGLQDITQKYGVGYLVDMFL